MFDFLKKGRYNAVYLIGISFYSLGTIGLSFNLPGNIVSICGLIIILISIILMVREGSEPDEIINRVVILVILVLLFGAVNYFISKTTEYLAPQNM
jgi:uncharacterized membrane protein